MSVIAEAGAALGVAPLCAALGVSRATFYRSQAPKSAGTPGPRPPPPRALSPEERAVVLDVLHEPRFADQAPAEVYHALLDEGVHRCSTSTMHRILADNQEIRERRDQLRHPAYTAPELLAEGPNQVWRWTRRGTHHEAARPGEVKLLLPLCHPRHLHRAATGLTSWAG